MNYSKNIHKDYSTLGNTHSFGSLRLSKRETVSCAVGTLTNYKKFVDKHEVRHYGLTANNLEEVHQKLKKQKQFLDFSYLYDRINQNAIPLSELLISANHNPQRYYALIQNRVNTLTKIAKQRELVPIFMTITLPSEFHRCTFRNEKLIENPKYDGTTPKEAKKILTKMFAKLRHDRSLKELTKEQRIYFRVDEPHKDGTPHTHILMFIPSDKVERIKRAFQRLFDTRGNNIQSDIGNATSYVMKYINKTLPLSKQEKLSEKEKYLNAWYSYNKILRFSSSRTLAPLGIYRLLHKRYSLYALTKLINEKHFKIYVALKTNKVMEIIDGFGDTVYLASSNYDVVTRGSNLQNYSQTSDSAVGVS